MADNISRPTRATPNNVDVVEIEEVLSITKYFYDCFELEFIVVDKSSGNTLSERRFLNIHVHTSRTIKKSRISFIDIMKNNYSRDTSTKFI